MFASFTKIVGILLMIAPLAAFGEKPPEPSDEYVPVPGVHGKLIHRTCIYEIPTGASLHEDGQVFLEDGSF